MNSKSPKIIVFASGFYLGLVSLLWQSNLIPSLAQGYGYGYGYGYSSYSLNQQLQHEALSVLYDSTDGKNWKISTDWKGDLGTECNWYGITCSAGYVTGVDLNGNNLKGTLPAAIGQLVNVQHLDLDGNHLSGEIPRQLSNLINLKRLDLSENTLEGSIPESLKNLENLNWLSLYTNKLSGNLPEWLGEISSLQLLLLGGNQFNGPIPESLGNLQNLLALGLSDNDLAGEIPNNIERLKNLIYLFLNDNSFSGSIPSELGNLNSLVYLSLKSNFLEGPIPLELFNLSNLTHLELDRNRFDGKIPSQISNLKQLISLSLFQNLLSGTIPAAISQLPNLQYLYLNANNLSGEIPQQLGDLSQLLEINFANNLFSGELPLEFGKLTSIRSLNLSHNELTGQVPGDIKYFVNLEVLDLSDNTFNGGIPDLSDLNALKRIDISKNRFARPLPEWLFSLASETVSYEDALNKLASLQIHPTTSPKIDSDGKKGENISLSGAVAAGDGLVVGIGWLVNGELVSEKIDTELRFSDGISKVDLRAIDDLGEISIESIFIEVKPPVYPTAIITQGQSNYKDSDGARGEKVLFKGQAEDADGSIITQRWLLNSEEIATGAEVLISMPNGNSTVVFEVTDNVGLKTSQRLTTFVEPAVYISTGTWPMAYNGIPPDANLKLPINNIGVYQGDTGTWKTCVNLTLNNEAYLIDGYSSFDINFRIHSIEDATIQLENLRPFNLTGALNSANEFPNCSGRIETSTGVYTDIIGTGSSTFETTFILINAENYMFALQSFKHLEPTP